MNKTKDQNLYEQINHSTMTAPYSVHFTDGIAGYEPALYLHWHNEMEFFWLEQGDLLFHIEDTTFPLHAGEIIFIPPGLIHHANNTGNIAPKFHAFVLDGSFLIPPYETERFNTYILPVLHNNLGFAVKLTKGIPWQENIIEYLKNICLNKNAGELQIRGLSLIIWNLMYQNLIAKTVHSPINSPRMDKLAAVMDYIHNNYSQSIALEDLAELVHLSSGQFCRSFKEFTGMTPFYYLIRYRILQSCNDLLSTDKKITDIATSCGFNNISYYNRVFLKIMGMTPKEYRKTCESGQSPL